MTSDRRSVHHDDRGYDYTRLPAEISGNVGGVANFHI